MFAAPESEKLDDPENQAAVQATLDRAEQAADVSQVTDPYETKAITPDGRVGFGDVIYPVPAHEIDDAARDELADTAAPAREAGVQVEFGGGLVAEEQAASSESMGILVGFLVLAITLGSLLAAGLPLLTASSASLALASPRRPVGSSSGRPDARARCSASRWPLTTRCSSCPATGAN